jgi:hypothetical protein
MIAFWLAPSELAIAARCPRFAVWLLSDLSRVDVIGKSFEPRHGERRDATCEPRRGESERGKSELRRAVRRLTAGQGNLKESGTENTQLTLAQAGKQW